MAYDTWFIGGSAQHSAEIARTLAYAAVDGREGLFGVDDFKVQPLETPGESFRVMPGAAGILARHAGAAYESYIARLRTQDVVPFTATGSGGGRTDLIVARVLDYSIPGSGITPDDPVIGPFTKTHVIEGVPPGTKSIRQLPAPYNSWSALTIGYIIAPASTAVVTAGMVNPTSDVTNPRVDTFKQSIVIPGDRPLSSASLIDWPAEATYQVPIPSWATKLIITMQAHGCMCSTGAFIGSLRAVLGPITLQEFPIDGLFPGTTPPNSSWRFSKSLDLMDTQQKRDMRGTTQTLKLQGKRVAGVGIYTATARTVVDAEVNFGESVMAPAA